MSSMTDGAQSEKTTDGGENSTNRGENSINRGENSANGGENSTNRGDNSTNRGENSANGEEMITNGGEKVTNGGENSTNGGEKVTNGGENSTNKGEMVTNRGEEVKMMFNRRLHTTETDSKEGGLTKIDDMWLSDDQLPLGMGHTTGNQIFRQAMKGYRWPEKRLYYRLSKKFVPWQKRMIKDALKKIERKIGKNCVKFVDRTRKRGYAVEVRPVRREEGCTARLGYVDDQEKQRMGLANHCFYYKEKGKKFKKYGTIQHEFLHSLGIYHTQSRKDRDDYVELFRKNVKNGIKWKNGKRTMDLYWDNFRIQPQAYTFGLPYDYESVMHYSGQAFANSRALKKKYLTIRTKKREFQNKIGQRYGLSKGDVNLIKKMYKCK